MTEKKSILIVDDIMLNWKILSKILIDDFNIITAENGQEALEQLAKEPEKIAGIMLDLVMPVMDGFTFLEEIKKYEAYQEIPIIVVTENGAVEVEKKVLQMGAWDFVSKPYDLQIIKFRLKNAIERSRVSTLERMRYLSQYDSLTNIYKKSMFYEATRTMIDEHPDIQFLFLRFDIDRFQLVNSFYGLSEGDKVLKTIGLYIQEFASTKKLCTYGRIEADIFGVCFPFRGNEAMVEGIERVKEKLKNYPLDFDLVPTIGLYVVTDPGLSVDNMFDNANLAAKTVKGNYINSFAFYVEDMSKAIRDEQEIINEMTAALKEEQFVVYLQPKYSLQGKKPSGAEALARWVHPTKGMISPQVFIPVFERNGFIAKLDYYMWEKVCCMLKGWIDSGITPNPISVNVSRVNLYNPHIVDILCELTDKYQVPRHLLNLELTESVYTDNPIVMQETMKRFHKEGFIVMMDDFGSGYSSLNILKDIEFDVLKIDMRFFFKSPIPGRGESIIASVVRMAKWLHIPTIAEGVEEEKQVEFLRNIGCEYVQGFYFAKPMPVAEYEPIAASGNKIMSDRISNFDAKQIFAIDSEMEHLLANSSQATGIYEYSNGCVEILRVNSAYYDLVGYDDQCIHASNLLEVMEEKSRVILQNALEQVASMKGTLGCEYERVLSNGKRIWVHVKLKYIDCIENKNIILATHLDVTAEKQIEDSFTKYCKAIDYNDKGEKEYCVLIIDDIEMNRVILREMMEDKIKILEASNGQEALQIMEEKYESIQLILLDIVMPVMDGREFLKNKNKNLLYQDIAVIVITVEDDAQLQLNMLENGVNDYITKPFIKEMVLRRIRNVLEYNYRFRSMMYEYSKISKKLSVQNTMFDTMLVVDDSETTRAVIKGIFEKQFTILEASDGRKAMEILKQYNYRVDIILLDLIMPVMDGKEFLTIKRENDEMVDIPVVVITTDDTVEHQVNMLEMGANDYIVKPIVEEVLVRRVSNVMESNFRYQKMLREYYNVVEQAHADPLTHLYNRNAAERMITKILEENPDERHAMIMMDIDEFKGINDTYGHNYGDVVLITLADKMKNFFRNGDILARVGGDEFCIFMKNINNADIAIGKSRALCEQVEAMKIGNQNVSVTCSIGVTITSKRNSTFAKLYYKADQAMYESKKHGKNTVYLMED